jgi:signal transduction histidine kinase
MTARKKPKSIQRAEGRPAVAPRAVQPRFPSEWAQVALDGLMAHLCVLDARGMIVAVNRAWRDYGGQPGPGAALLNEGANYLAVCDSVTSGPQAAEAAAVARGLREVLSGARASFELEYPCPAASGAEWFVLMAAGIEGPAGTCAVVAHQPITARKWTEYRQRDLQKLEMLGTLAGGIAHDFNNSLAAMLGSASLGLDQVADAEQASEHFDRILQAGRRARDLVGQILTFGRPPSTALAPHALGPLVKQSLALLRLTVPEGVALEAQLCAQPLCGWTDPMQFEQVLMNLCTNAWHAMEGRPGRIVVGLEPVLVDAALANKLGLPGADRYAHLWVADNGQGMTEAVQRRIFEPFFTTRQPGHGTGLGLAVVRNIVCEHGGSIEVQSSPGQGSTFHLHLPLSSRKPAAAPAPVRAQRSLRLGDGRRIMVIDDDELVGTVTQALLEKESAFEELDQVVQAALQSAVPRR